MFRFLTPSTICLASASAQSFVFESYSGCFTGPRRSTIESSAESASVLFYYNDDGSKMAPITAGTSKESKLVVDRLVNLELSNEEVRLLEGLDDMIGPAHFTLTMTVDSRVWKVSYPAFLAGLSPDKKKLLKYDAATLAMIEKIEKIHSTVTGFIPKNRN